MRTPTRDYAGMNFEDTNYNGAELSNTNMRFTNWFNSDLSQTDLNYSIFTKADLRFANLSFSMAGDVDFREADLRQADLTNIDMVGADCRGADLRGTIFKDADFRGGYLTGAVMDETTDFNGALLYYTDMEWYVADRLRRQYSVGIDTGQLIGWQSVAGHLIKLAIPGDAKMVCGMQGNKCRSDYAEVLDITTPDGERFMGPISDPEDPKGFVYKVSAPLSDHDFDPDPMMTNGFGVDFFRTPEEAEGRTPSPMRHA